MTGRMTDERRGRLLDKVRSKAASEIAETLNWLGRREDRLPGYDYFLNLAEAGFSAARVEERTGRPVIYLFCVQAPLELIHAAGFSPFKVFSGSSVSGNLASQGLPAVMCPLLKAVLGARQLNKNSSERLWVLPTTCDWVVKFPEMLNLIEGSLWSPYWVELPHIKDAPESQERWLDEIVRLKRFLEDAAGRKIGRKRLADSINLYHAAWRAWCRLIALRRLGLIASPWFFLITNTFFLDHVESWTAALERLLPTLSGRKTSSGKLIFLGGSPIFFPNFKLPGLIEEAGLTVIGDDLCSSERLFPGGVSYSDTSEFGLCLALAQRYHQGCLCPTFADNDRRINNILAQLKNTPFQGVVFQSLKGCHPYDLESFTIEPGLKRRGLKFIRLETDYAASDGQNLLTRLEAFARTLKGN